MPSFTIVSLQLSLKGTDNFAEIEHELNIAKIKFPNVDMVVIGELALYGPLVENNLKHQDTTLERLCAIAKRNNYWLIPGSYFEKIDGKNYNSCPVISPQGELVATHHKMFPFYPFEMDVEAGTTFVTFDVAGAGRFGLCICYDMWFPEVTRNLMAMGAEVIIHPTMSTTVDRDVELAICRTNAAINQCYFVDVNVAGHYGLGRSVVCGPGGEVLHQAGSGREVISTSIDFDYVRRVREEGWNSLGQPVKSFRDSPLSYPVYEKNGKNTPFLRSLGEIHKPGKFTGKKA